MRFQILFLGLFSTMLSCQTNQGPKRDFSRIPLSTAFEAGLKTGVIQGDFVRELSGIAASRRTPGAYWVQSDGSRYNEIYLIDSLGKRLSTCQLPGVKFQDGEDIAVGKDPKTGISYVYFADIGDNKSEYSTRVIYRFPEPEYVAGNEQMTASAIEKLEFVYPGGERHNAETLLFDPASQDLLIFTKAPDGGILFRFPFPQNPNEVSPLERVAELPIDKATAGDISPDGKSILIKNKKEIFYWEGQAGQSVLNLLTQSDPVKVPYTPEAQGEAVCFNLWNTGFLCSSERGKAEDQPLYYYNRRSQ